MPVHSKPVPIVQQPRNFPEALLAWYLLQIASNPLRTKAITAGVFSGLQEFLAQKLSGSRNKGKAAEKKTLFGNPNNDKIFKMTLYGLLVSGPLSHILFEAINKIFKDRAGTKAKILHFLTSALIVLPIQNAVYLAAMASIEGENTLSGVLSVVSKSFWPLMKVSWVGFPLTLTFSKRFVRPDLWVPFFNLVGFVLGLIGNTNTKLIQQKKTKEQERED
ncbi:hypothetical protein G9A89_017367 [Geosiphon pyriformis]|nr:hypothetical protein G9A89_017367 [Geosiphon pyriformis]